MTPPSANTQRLLALREANAHTQDPVGWHYLQTLASRTAAQSGAAQDLLQKKLHQALDSFEARLQNVSPLTRFEQPPTSPLALLLQDMQAEVHRHSSGAGRMAATSGPIASDPKRENPRLLQFRRQLHSMSVQKQVRQAVAQAPQNAGPINSHMLMLRALVLLRDISPAYLDRFMAHVDTLLRLEDAQRLRLQTSRNKPTGKSRR